MPTPPSIGSTSLLPLSTLPDETKKPASPHLALVGPLSPTIGRPLHAFSEVNLQGYEVSLGKKASPAQLWLAAFKPALAIGVVFGGLLGALVMLVSRDSDLAGPVVGLIVGLTALFTFVFRPKRKGFSGVVGTDGMDVGVVDGDQLTRAAVLYDEDRYVFFENGTNIYTRRAGHPKPSRPTTVQMILAVRERAGLGLLTTMNFAWHPMDLEANRAPGHRPGLYLGLVENGYPRRVAAARARLDRGEPVELPTVDGRVVRILPAPGAGGLPRAVELGRGASRELDVTRIELRQGKYTFEGGGKSARLGRDQVGDAFVLDALVLAPTGAEMSAESESEDGE